MKFLKYLIKFIYVGFFLGVAIIVGFYQYVKSDLPNVATLKNIELQTPMMVYTKDGKLIAQFGEKRRIPVTYEEIPQNLINALIATEDSRFYDHFGIDPVGITRALIVVAQSGSASQGASTITQQVARNFFLSSEKKLIRKIKEIFLALDIEQQLTKQEIMTLYVNQIFLGYRSYGFAAAAYAYFGKQLDELTLSEVATLAGLPKAPSTMNPIYSLTRATDRRNVVLLRMLDENYISNAEYQQAKAEPILSRFHNAHIELNAPYIAELARQWTVETYGEEKAYTSGLNIYMTIDSKLQVAAHDAAINNLLAYDQRHGYRGAEKILWQEGQEPWKIEQIDEHLTDEPIYGDIYPAVVLNVNELNTQVWIKNKEKQELIWDDVKWARRFMTDEIQGDEPLSINEVLKVGQQIWVQEIKINPDDAQDHLAVKWVLSQVPNANTSFVAIDPNTGSVLSLVGGFNFIHSKFNRATMSVRQVGSSIKPFIYSAGIDKGLTLASLINDSPINYWDANANVAWRPKNSPDTYLGPTRLRIGLAQSKNVMAIRVLRKAGGAKDVRDFLTKFGFDEQNVPLSETIALGAGSLTPLELAQGYSVFANGGYFLKTHYIEKVENQFNEIIFKAVPDRICSEVSNAELDVSNIELNGSCAPQVISEHNAFLIRDAMYSNIWGGGSWRYKTGWNGTGWRGQQLKRHDIGGKTGTTNDLKDAWYSGYGPNIVAVSWIGFDDNSRTLGKVKRNENLGKEQMVGGESGAKTALPAWVDFMKVALADVPEQEKDIPSGIIRVRIDRETGLLTNKINSSSMLEYFSKGSEPKKYVTKSSSESLYSELESEPVVLESEEELF